MCERRVWTRKGGRGGCAIYRAGETGNNKLVLLFFVFLSLKMDPDSVAVILEPISPALAASHFVKGRSRQANLSRCSKCGYSLLYGTSHTRIVHNNSKTKQRSAYLQRSCTTCGHINNTLLQPVCRDPTRASPQVVTPRTPGTDQFPPNPTPSVPSPSTSTAPSSHLHPPLHLSDPSPLLASAQPQPLAKSRKSRPKHKANLRDILARSKASQHEAKNRGTSGLATFLHSL